MDSVSNVTLTSTPSTNNNYSSQYGTTDNNDGSGSAWQPTVPVYVFSACYGITSVLGIIGNGAILTVFAVERKLLRNNFNLLILNLTFADFCIALLDLPFQVVSNQLGYWPWNAVDCALLVFCDWGMTFVSIYTLVAISIDRHWAACWGQSYRIHNTRKRTLGCIAFIWFLLMVTWTPAYLVDRIRVGNEVDIIDCDFSLDDNPAFAFFVIVAGYHIPSFIMIFCYVRVYAAVRKARQTVTPLVTPIAVKPWPPCAPDDARTVGELILDGQHPHRETIIYPDQIASISRYLSPTIPSPPTILQGNNTAPNPPIILQKQREKRGETFRREMRVFRSLSYIVTAYLILWTPCHIVVDVMCFDATLVSGDLYSLVSALCYINSAINPLLYAASNEQTRRAMRRVFCCKRRTR